MAVLILTGVVDRIEGNQAVVEWWPSAETCDVALSVLPARISEGQTIVLLARGGGLGRSIVVHDSSGTRLLTPRGSIGLPTDAQLPADQLYTVRFRRRPDATRPRSPGRAHPATGTREHGRMDLRSFRVGAPISPPKTPQ